MATKKRIQFKYVTFHSIKLSPAEVKQVYKETIDQYGMKPGDKIWIIDLLRSAARLGFIDIDDPQDVDVDDENQYTLKELLAL